MMEPTQDNNPAQPAGVEQNQPQTLTYTLHLLSRIADGENLALRELPFEDRWGSFEPELNPEQNKMVLQATIDCITKMRSRDPVASDLINLNDLPQTFHPCLCRYVEGTIRAANTKEDANFADIRATMDQWKATIADIVKEDPRFYPQFVIGKTELLAMLVDDCENAGGAPRHNFGKEASPGFQALVQKQLADRVPTVARITRSESDGFQFEGLHIAPATISGNFLADLKAAFLEDRANNMLGRLTEKDDHYIVSWGGTTAFAKGVVIDGKPISWMQHGSIVASTPGDSRGEQVGHYTRLPNKQTDTGVIRTAILMVKPGSQIEVDAASAREGYYEPSWY